MLYARTLRLGLLFSLVGCAAGDDGGSSRDGALSGDGASSGGPQQSQQTAMPAAPSPTADPREPQSGGFGNAAAQPSSSAGRAAPMPRAMDPAAGTGCVGGFYLGTYDCEVNVGGLPVPLMGDVSFVLEIDETSAVNDCDAEFCPDLVIAEGSGTLFGLAGLLGFEARLDGGLDCATGEFRADAPSGVWGGAGSSDPSDPDALWTVLDPPFGMFRGSLSGQHMQGRPDSIAGDWDLLDSVNGYRCAGPFTVSLQP